MAFVEEDLEDARTLFSKIIKRLPPRKIWVRMPDDLSSEPPPFSIFGGTLLVRENALEDLFVKPYFKGANEIQSGWHEAMLFSYLEGANEDPMCDISAIHKFVREHVDYVDIDRSFWWDIFIEHDTFPPMFMVCFYDKKGEAIRCFDYFDRSVTETIGRKTTLVHKPRKPYPEQMSFSF